jgi:SAM-dependent methyltransferase
MGDRKMENKVENQVTEQYFDEMKSMLEPVYLAGETPWNQSGFSGTEERWNRLRRPIADCIDRSGRFLDIGCANGYLIECVVHWTKERGLEVEPYGLDISAEFVELAQRRLPQWADRLFVGNAWTWVPPQRFDFVSTELVYVPEELRRDYVQRLLDLFVADDGTLLLSEYRASRDADRPNWASEYVGKWGHAIERIESGIDISGKELTRVTVVRKK